MNGGDLHEDPVRSDTGTQQGGKTWAENNHSLPQRYFPNTKYPATFFNLFEIIFHSSFLLLISQKPFCINNFAVFP